MDDEMMKYVYLSMAGEAQQGGPGCTFVDTNGGAARYVRTTDMVPEKFRAHLREQQDADENNHYFIVTKAEQNLHVFKFKRADAAAYDWSGLLSRVRDSAS